MNCLYGDSEVLFRDSLALQVICLSSRQRYHAGSSYESGGASEPQEHRSTHLRPGCQPIWPQWVRTSPPTWLYPGLEGTLKPSMPCISQVQLHSRLFSRFEVHKCHEPDKVYRLSAQMWLLSRTFGEHKA